jgi:APA family basic amino acid/polyamine antiporter
VRITIFTAIVVAILAGFIPLDELAALANAGTLAAFTAVSVCMLIMRRRAPDAPRTFRAPMPWIVGTIAVFGCFYLFLSLPAKTQLWFGVWNVAGLAVYFLYARRNAIVA